MEENRKGTGVFYAVVGVATLVVAIVGATFAYFTATATVNGNDQIGGTTATASNATVTVARVYPSAGKAVESEKMVPLLPERISDAISTTNKCVDKSGYIACHIYSVTVSNDDPNADTIYVDTQLQLTVGTIANMRWAVMDDANTVTMADGNTGVEGQVEGATKDFIGEDLALDGGESHTYYVLVWLHDTNQPQETTDAGQTFTGAVTANFVDANGGQIGNLTATFAGTAQEG